MNSAPRYIRSKAREGRLSTSTKFYQAIGGLPETFKNFAFSTFLLFYYSQVLAVPPVNAATIIAAALIIDAFCDPLIGSFSDNLKTGLGRRHALMFISAAPLGLGLYLTFSPPVALAGGELLVWMFVTVTLTNISMSLFAVPWTALFAEFSDDSSERTAVVTYRFAVGVIGSLTFTALTWRFVFARTAAFHLGQLNPHAYQVFAPVLAVSAVAAIMLTTQLTRREIPFLLQPHAENTAFHLRQVWRDVSGALANRDFLILFGCVLTSSAITGTLTTLNIYLSTYFWGLGGEQLQWFSLAIVGVFAAFASVGALERRFDKKPLLLACLMLLVVDGSGAVVLRLLNVLPPNGTPILLALLVANEVFRGFLGTVLGIVFVAMLADTIDQQEDVTGHRQEGVFAAALAFSGKATAGLGSVIAGVLLAQVIHWPANGATGAIGTAVILRLGLIVGVWTPMLLVVPLLFAARYSITRERRQATRRSLDHRRTFAMAEGNGPVVAKGNP